ncbi:hypothetical protein BGY98DRAFT_550778 [Russula aff. rugulosa BPL654]|nr:hypothetical protein BGY98DRAFT_550778 [Russula aff. rugulosa BPL654]
MPDTSRVTSRRHGRRPDLDPQAVSCRISPFDSLYLHPFTSRRAFLRFDPTRVVSIVRQSRSSQDSTISDSHAVPISTQPRDSPMPLLTSSGKCERTLLRPQLLVLQPPYRSFQLIFSGRHQATGCIAASSAGQICLPPPRLLLSSSIHRTFLNQPFGSSDAGPASTPTLPLPTSPDIPPTPHIPRACLTQSSFPPQRHATLRPT